MCHAQGTVPALLQLGVPGAVQSPSAFVPALPPAARTQGQASLATPGPATPGDICACCCDTAGEMEPPTLIPWGWTDAAAGITDTGKDECPRRPGLAGDGAGARARTKPQALGASLPAWTPQPCSAWGSAPPDHHSHTASPRWLCMAWGRARTLSLPLDLSSHSGCPRSLSDPGWDRPCVGTDTAAPGGRCGTPAPSLTARACPSSAGTAPLTPGLTEGISPNFLNKIIVS